MRCFPRLLVPIRLSKAPSKTLCFREREVVTSDGKHGHLESANVETSTKRKMDKGSYKGVRFCDRIAIVDKVVLLHNWTYIDGIDNNQNIQKYNTQ